MAPEEEDDDPYAADGDDYLDDSWMFPEGGQEDNNRDED
jgi:hypothetical protein